MLKNGTKKILLVVIALIAILMFYTGNAYAINIMQQTNNVMANQSTNIDSIQSIEGVGVQNNTVNSVNNVAVSNNTINNVKPQTSNVSTYTNSDLPKTGVEDYPLVILMAVCVIAAIYAYIKVRNYNSL